MAWWDQRRFTGDSYGDFPLPLPAGCAKSLEKISIDSIVHPAPGLRLTECNRMTDPALPYMKGVQDGDADAPARLIDLFQGRIYAFLRRLAGSDSDAVELTQRTFCRVWTALPTFAGRSSVASWMHSIAYRTYADWLRSERRNQPMPDDWWSELADGGEGPDRLSAAAHDKSVVYAAVDRLPSELRDTVHLHYYQGLTIEETAIALDVATSTVKHRVRRAVENRQSAIASPISQPASFHTR